MSNIRRTKPNFVWSHYRITLDLYAINDNRVDSIIDHIDDFISSLPTPPMYQIEGDDPCHEGLQL